MEHFRPHLETLVKDMKAETHEASHCFASEIVSSIICGSKYWTYEKVGVIY